MSDSGLDSSEKPGPAPGPFSSQGDPTYLKPFDFGEDRQLVVRALELNRQLLYETGPEVRCDRAAVQKKIDHLLDRLIEHDCLIEGG